VYPLLGWRFLLALAAVAVEGAGGSELAQLVANHFLGDVHVHVPAAVVHHERMAHELRHDRAAASPGLDRLLGVALVEALHLFEQLGVHKGTLFERSSHDVVALLSSSSSSSSSSSIAFEDEDDDEDE